MSAPLRPKIGLLALTLELYEQLAPTLRNEREGWVRAQVIPALERTADILFDRAIFRKDDIEATVQEFEARGADAILVVLLTYAPSQLALPALRRTRLPLVIWNTQENFTVDQDYKPVDLRNNHGVHGTQDLANVLVRSAVPFHYVTSHLRDAGAVDELNDFFRCAAAVQRLRDARFGLLGYPFPGMGDFAMDTTQMAAMFGCSWTALSVENYNQRAAQAAEADVAALAAEYRSAYAVGADVTQEDLQFTARAELALRGMVADENLDGLSYQFLSFGEDERTVTLPFVGVSRLMAEGIGFGGEGDLMASATTRLLHWAAPPVTFSEIFTVDYAGNTLLMSHMGEMNAGMARRDRKIALVARPAPITRTRERQLALVTTLEPGPATLTCLSIGPGGKWRLLAAPVAIVDFGPLPSFCTPHFKIAPQGDVRDFLTRYGRLGGPHHNAVCFGDMRGRLRMLAEILGIDYCEI